MSRIRRIRPLLPQNAIDSGTDVFFIQNCPRTSLFQRNAMPAFGGERAPAAQPLLELRLSRGDLDANPNGLIGGADHSRAVRKRDRDGQHEGRQDAEHRPIVREA